MDIFETKNSIISLNNFVFCHGKNLHFLIPAPSLNLFF